MMRLATNKAPLLIILLLFLSRRKIENNNQSKVKIQTNNAENKKQNAQRNSTLSCAADLPANLFATEKNREYCILLKFV